MNDISLSFRDIRRARSSGDDVVNQSTAARDRDLSDRRAGTKRRGQPVPRTPRPNYSLKPSAKRGDREIRATGLRRATPASPPTNHFVDRLIFPSFLTFRGDSPARRPLVNFGLIIRGGGVTLVGWIKMFAG